MWYTQVWLNGSEHSEGTSTMPTTEFAGQTAGLYPRVSSKKQAKRDRNSLSDQETACRAYTDDLGMVVDEACVKPEAYTSTVMKRPELNLLLAEMKARHVPNLIIDRADRLTRAGQIAAATFLQQFTRAGIVLHVVSMDLIVRDDKGIKDFLDAAYQARQDNLQRARIVARAKRSLARAGRYLRGNKAPYGHRYVACEWDDEGNVLDKKMVLDERSFLDLGFPTTFAPTPSAARREMVRLYAQGWSWKRIATRLDQEHVPTPDALAHCAPRSARGHLWWYQTVRYLVLHPLNAGILTNFRNRYSLADPDETHDEEWTQVRVKPISEHILVTPRFGGPEPLADAATLAQVEARAQMPRPKPIPNGIYAERALLSGGRARCALCGGPLRVRSVRRKTKVYLYYACHRHELQRAACPGLSLPVTLLDPGAWFSVVDALTTLGEGNDSYLDVLAATQAKTDTRAETGADYADNLRRVRDAFQVEAETLADELGKTRSALARDAIQRRIDRLEPEIVEATRKLAAHAHRAETTAARRALLGDVLEQWLRYSDVVLHLDPYVSACLPTMQAILRLTGAVLTIGKTARGAPTVAVAFTFTPQTAAPWFTAEALAALAAWPPDDLPPSPHGRARVESSPRSARPETQPAIVAASIRGSCLPCHARAVAFPTGCRAA